MRISYLLILLALLTMCKTDRVITQEFKATAPLVIYKTKADFSNNVPIILNDSKDAIISYPSPGDVYFNGVLAVPVKLKHGFCIDNMGITKNSVYTSYTFDEYSKLTSAPALDDLMKSILEKDPFIEIYDCGARGDVKTSKDINKLISSKFKNCKKLK